MSIYTQVFIDTYMDLLHVYGQRPVTYEKRRIKRDASKEIHQTLKRDLHAYENRPMHVSKENFKYVDKDQ